MTLRSLIKRSSLFIAALITVSGTLSSALAQHTLSPDPGNPLAGPANGMRRTDLGWQAFTNATIHVAPGKTIENGTLVVRDGKIVAILPAEGGKPAPMPIGPIVRDCTGMHIYPGFIDAYVEVATPLPDLNAPGAHWSAKVKGIGNGYWRVVAELEDLIELAAEFKQRTLFGIGFARSIRA